MFSKKIIKNNLPGAIAIIADFSMFTLILLPIPLFVKYANISALLHPLLKTPEAITIPTILIFLFIITGSYKSPMADLGSLSFKKPLVIIWIITISIIVYLLNQPESISNSLSFLSKIIAVASIFSAFIMLNRIVIQIFISLLLKINFLKHKVLFAFHHNANTPYVKEYKRRINSNNQTLVGYCCNKQSTLQLLEDVKHLGTFLDSPRICTEENVDEIIIFNYKHAIKDVEKILTDIDTKNLIVRIAPTSEETIIAKSSKNMAQDAFTSISIQPKKPNFIYRSTKRIIDIIAAIIGLFITAFIYPFMAYKIKKSSPGPVIYKQKRENHKQKEFTLYKFRTMYIDAEKDGPELAKKTIDPRITPIGKIFRRIHLDELPQFWNLLKGDMSLVGIRPERQYYSQKLIKTTPYYKLIKDIKPGITSLGMVKYGYAHNVKEMEERMIYDIIYLNNQSFLFDLQIIGYTITYIINKILFKK